MWRDPRPPPLSPKAIPCSWLLFAELVPQHGFSGQNAASGCGPLGKPPTQAQGGVGVVHDVWAGARNAAGVADVQCVGWARYERHGHPFLASAPPGLSASSD